MPATLRLNMPFMALSPISIPGVFHRRTWCSKKIDCSPSSTTASSGTSSPLIWYVTPP